MSGRIILRDAIKTHSFELEKTISPEETLRRFRERLAAVDLDILEEAVRIDNGRLDVPVFFSLCGKDAEAVIGNKKQMGKGGTAIQAEASAVMELAERFSLFSFKANPANFAVMTHREAGENAMPLEAIRLSVHDETADADVALDFFSDIPLRWAKGENLTAGGETLIPFDWFYALNEFNGSAAGNCIEEAVIQAVCEVVERHVCSVVSRGTLKVPSIDPGSVTDPMALELLDKFRRAGIRLVISDMSLETGIPTVGALAWDPATFPARSEIVWTAGTSPDPQKALIRALTEVAQLAGDFNSGSNYVASGLPKFASLEEATFLTEGAGSVPISSLPNVADGNIKVEIKRCIENLARSGLQVFMIDVTHPELGIPSVYAVVPGAHFRERTIETSVGMFTAKRIAGDNAPATALCILEEMDRRLPEKYYIHFFLGLSYLENGEPEKALSSLEKAASLDPDGQELPTVYSYLGVCLKEMGNYREAIDILKRAESLDRERTDIHNLMGFCHFKLKEYETAIECFRNVLALNPSSGIDYANIASNYRDMGKTDEAVQYYRLALELDPNLDFARENLEKLSGTADEG